MTTRPDVRPHAGWTVAVDVGGATVAAAVRSPAGRVEPLEIEGRVALPAGVWVGGDGALAVGTSGLRQGLLSPQRWVRSPVLGLGAAVPDPRVDPVTAVAALLTEVRFAALARTAPNPHLVLVSPTGWSTERRAALVAAATRAGFGSVETVDAAVAAALYLRTTDLLPRRGRIAVCDVGATAVTCSVLDVDGPRIRVLAATRTERIAGDRLDAVIFEQIVGQVLGLRNPELGRNLIDPPDPRWRRMRESLRREIRRAREELSRYGAVEVHPEAADDIFLELTRYDFDNLVRPDVGLIVDELRACVTRSGLDVQELHGVQLLGGVGRTPLLARRLVTALAHSPWLAAEPQLALALGAARLAEAGGDVTGPEQDAGPDVVPVRVAGSGPAPVARPAPGPEPESEPGPEPESEPGPESEPEPELELDPEPAPGPGPVVPSPPPPPPPPPPAPPSAERLVAEPLPLSAGARLGWGALVVGLAVVVLVAVAVLIGLQGRADRAGAAPAPTRTPTRWDSWGPDAELARVWQAVVPTSAAAVGSRGQRCGSVAAQEDPANGTVVCRYPDGVELSILRFASAAGREVAQQRVAGGGAQVRSQAWTERDLEGKDQSGTIYVRSDRAWRWWSFASEPTYAMSARWPDHDAEQLASWWDEHAPFT